MKGSGRVEYVFANVQEQIEIKLQSQYFSSVETRQESCNREEGYSDLKVSMNVSTLQAYMSIYMISAARSASGESCRRRLTALDFGCTILSTSPARITAPCAI